jgi:hypothetical protein
VTLVPTANPKRLKGDQPGKKRLYNQDGNDPTTGWRHEDFDVIGPSLSFELDVSSAKRIEANAARGGCFQGQTHGHKGFLVQPNDRSSGSPSILNMPMSCSRFSLPMT